MNSQAIEVIGSLLFVCAILHTFLVPKFQLIAQQYPEGSIPENFFHLLGEVEIVFGVWAAIFVSTVALLQGGAVAVSFMNEVSFTEPLFVFSVMTVAATRPLLVLTERLIVGVSGALPLNKETSILICALILGPCLGGFITEPAAMTVTALLLKKSFFDKGYSVRFKYGALAVLLVNVSIGGVTTHFAAPPVVMVAGVWGWGTDFMFAHFGWKALIAVTANTLLLIAFFYKELRAPRIVGEQNESQSECPAWLIGVHLAFLFAMVLTAHHPSIFVPILLFFLGTATITKEFQDELKIREALLVGFFLAGLVVLGRVQNWWLAPLITSLNEGQLFLGTTALTAVTDNAALTFLGSQVSGLTDSLKYALVAGAVAGGGLTVMANAPNPAAFSILKDSFGSSGISSLWLIMGAIFPTVVAVLAFWFL